ncbi:MAG TPA: hypothetical protein PK987_01995 [Ferruginibacter sp.]|nr:hypothetical protein [Ferruginibacter sp.]
MVQFLFKWLMVFLMPNFQTASNAYYIEPTGNHPIYVSVTQIEHNAKDKTLEISCKIFTDDFEHELRRTYKGTVDLLQPKDKAAMNKLVSAYVQKHLLLNVNGKSALLNFIGYEQDEEGIISYYQVNDIALVKKIDVVDNILFDYKEQQINIVHVIVNGKRKSTKLVNPDATYSFAF